MLTYRDLGHTAYHHVGVDGVSEFLWSPTARTVGAIASAFHGYRRNRSVGWAVVWGLLGHWSPPITVTIAVAQGFGKPKAAPARQPAQHLVSADFMRGLGFR